MQILITFFMLTIVILAYMRLEASLLSVERIKFTNDKKFVKVLQMSDIHLKNLKVSLKKIRLVIEQEKPDIILLTGDYIDNKNQINDFLKFLEYIKSNNKILLCLGNHDYKTFIKDNEGLNEFFNKITKKDIEVLNNSTYVLEKNNNIYNFIGLKDISYSNLRIDLTVKSLVKENATNIAFSHNPDIALKIPKNLIQYLFCGHYHGGQIWVPFNFEFKFLRNNKLGKKTIIRGLHKINDFNLYINRGIGNVIVPLRFLSRPEITIYYI